MKTQHKNIRIRKKPSLSFPWWTFIPVWAIFHTVSINGTKMASSEEKNNLSQQLCTTIIESYAQYCFPQLQLVKEESEPEYLPICSIFPFCSRNLDQWHKLEKTCIVIFHHGLKLFSSKGACRDLRWLNSITKTYYLFVAQTNQTHKTTINMQHRTAPFWCCPSPVGVKTTGAFN